MGLRTTALAGILAIAAAANQRRRANQPGQSKPDWFILTTFECAIDSGQHRRLITMSRLGWRLIRKRLTP